MQPRQASKCSTIEGVSGSPSKSLRSSGRCARAGESISSPHSAYVGQAGRQKPQCTQSETSSADGGRWLSKAGSPPWTEVSESRWSVPRVPVGPDTGAPALSCPGI